MSPTPIRRTAVSVALLVVAALAGPVLGRSSDDLDEFRDALKTESERARIQAVHDFGARDIDGVERELRKIVFSDPSELVSAEAARVLGERGDRRDQGFLLASLDKLKKRPIALAGAVDGLARYQEPRIVKPLYEVARDCMKKSSFPTQAAIRALGRVPTADSVDYLIRLYRQTYPSGGASGREDLSIPGATGDSIAKMMQACRPFIESSLTRLTGLRLGSCSDWESWWKKAERGFVPVTHEEDPNADLAFADDDFGYRITRPNDVWQWLESPEEGFSRTAEFRKDGRMSARLSILAYSTLLRTPETVPEMLERQKEELLARCAKVEKQEWSGRAKCGDIIVQQEIEGTRTDGTYFRIRQAVLRKGDTLFVLRLTLDKWASAREKKSAEDFLQSFRLFE